VRRLVFVDSRAQAAWVSASLPPDADTHVVAVTGDAMQALDEYRVPHTPASAYADTHVLAQANEALNQDTLRLARAIEAFIGERYEPGRFDGPGPLSGNAYTIQNSISSILRRALLMRGAIQVIAPQAVTVFEGDVDPWFANDGYTRDPWVDVIRRDAASGGFEVNLVALPQTMIGETSWQRLMNKACSLRHRLSRRLLTARSMPLTPASLPEDLAGLKLLFIASPTFDWAPVVDRLKQASDVSCYKANELILQSGQWWSPLLTPRLEPLVAGLPHELGIERPKDNPYEIRIMGGLFDDWLRDARTVSGFTILGIDVLPMIAGQLRLMACLGPTLIRYVDRVARSMLDRFEPHAVCFYALHLLVHQRFAFECRRRGIPVVSYQHGFGYAVRIQPEDELCDPAYADYFLTYGKGNQPRSKPAFPVRAKYISIGSARIEQMLRSRRHSPHAVGRLRVLWVSELWNHNTIGTFLTEETQRYDLYRTCLEALGRSQEFEVTYRPYPGMADAIARWIKRSNNPRVRVDGARAFPQLVQQADVAVVATSSPTVWAEVFALQTPMLLYCDPEQTLLTDAFSADLDRVCRWCRSGPALLDAIRQLATDGRAALDELNRLDTSAFVRHYILNGGGCADRAIAFLNDVCRHRRPVDEWKQPA
jgi:hypothetical protein